MEIFGIALGVLLVFIFAIFRNYSLLNGFWIAGYNIVWVYLTDTGKAAYKHHEEFHHEMIAQIKSQLTEQETPILIYALAKLADYFHLVYKGEKE